MCSKSELPIVITCSGRSIYGQLAHDIATSLNQENIAEMICIAQLFAEGVQTFQQYQYRPVILINGCANQCVSKCLQLFDITPHLTINLAEDFNLNLQSEEQISLENIYTILSSVLKRVTNEQLLLH